MSSHALCPSCTELVPASALRCRHCRELLHDFRECPDCRERVRAEARVCRYCGLRFGRSAPPPLPPAVPAQSVRAEPAVLGATPLGAFLGGEGISALVAPPEIFLENTRLVLGRWSWFGLQKSEREVALERLRSVHLRRGLFWSRLVCTIDGEWDELEIAGLRHTEAAAAQRVLEEIVGRNSSRRPVPLSSAPQVKRENPLAR